MYTVLPDDEKKRDSVETLFSDNSLTISKLSVDLDELGAGNIFACMVRVNATIEEKFSYDLYRTLADGIQDIYTKPYEYVAILTIKDASGKFYSLSGEVTGFHDDIIARAAEQRGNPPVRHDDTTAFLHAKEIVENTLKTPSTAKFCKMNEATIKDLGSGNYMVKGWVDAENEYGAAVRYDFVATYTATKEGYKDGNAELLPQG